MTVESLWITIVIIVASTLATGISAYSKGFKAGAEDSAEFIKFLKSCEEKEEEGEEK